MEISEEAREKREAYAADGRTAAHSAAFEKILSGVLETTADRIADLTRERDDLLAMKARVEIVADDLALCTCETCEGARSVGWRLRAAIRGES